MLLDIKSKKVQASGTPLEQLQEALSSGSINSDPAISDQFTALTNILALIRSWGHPYSQVEFSPQIKALLARADKTIIIQDNNTTFKSKSVGTGVC